MTEMQKALQYVVNAGGNATVASFVEDFEPIGDLLLHDLKQVGWLYADELGKLHISGAGRRELQA